MKGKELKIVIHDKYLDVTDWALRHPGGSAVLFAFNNRDATEQFIATHSDAAKRKLDNMLMSSSLTSRVEALPQSDHVKQAYSKLRDEFEMEGLFYSPCFVDTLYFVNVMSFYVFGFFLIKFTTCYLIGAVTFAWGMQQCGWLAHDYLHHSIFKNNVKLNDSIGSFLAWLQGYDSNWWKSRHNLHHVCTNEVHHDPDIELAPFLTYMHDKKIALNHFQKWQHIYFIPFLTLLHFSWLFSSMKYVIQHRMWVRVAALLAHYWFIVMVVFRTSDDILLWKYLILAMFFKGTVTALFVYSTHYPEIRLPSGANSMSLAQQTLMTTRNISGGPLVDWISGSISRQIEHHLFPTLPRRHLAKIAPRVKKMARDLNLPYVETSIWECMKANVACLIE